MDNTNGGCVGVGEKVGEKVAVMVFVGLGVEVIFRAEVLDGKSSVEAGDSKL